MIRLSGRDRRALIIGVAIIAGSTVLTSGIPAYVRLHERMAREAWLATREAERVSGALRRAAATEAALQDAHERFLSLAPRLIGGRETATMAAALAASVAGAADLARLELRSLTPVTDSAGGQAFQRVSLRAEAAGDLRHLLEFLEHLGALGPAVTIQEVSVEQAHFASADGEPEQLTLRLHVTAIGLRKPEGT